MPRALENKLKREAKARHYSADRTRRFVYGTLRKTGWKPKKKGKGESVMSWSKHLLGMIVVAIVFYYLGKKGIGGGLISKAQSTFSTGS